MSAGAQQKPADLDSVLHQLDAASKNFKSAQASFRRDIYTRVIKDTTWQCAVVYFEHKGGGLEMGMKLAPSPTPTCSGEASATADGTHTLSYKAGELRVFDPKLNQLMMFGAGNNKAQYESFLTLGFGGSGTDLAKTWNITYQGTEVLKESGKDVSVAKLDLVAKDPANRNMFSHITIWVDPVRGVTLKQQFFSPNGDQFTTYFDHIRYNANLNESAFAIKTDKETQVVRR